MTGLAFTSSPKVVNKRKYEVGVAAGDSTLEGRYATNRTCLGVDVCSVS